MLSLAAVEASPEAGLAGDRYGGRNHGKRQVTLVAREDLEAIGAFLGTAPVDPHLARRNLVTQGINLLALKGRCIEVGGAILEIAGECHPCSRMEELLGTGGYNAMRGRGGLTARVIRAGVIRLGDQVATLPAAP
jgi:MOSC domain-containing protein YiiM